jgi:metallophosphoesterase (TIGR00282 family)
MTVLKLIAFGDIVGKTGKAGIRKAIKNQTQAFQPDLIISNGENITGGLGIDAACFADLMQLGVDLVTLGDHAFQKRGSGELLNQNAHKIIRPANFPPGAPGSGYALLEKPGFPTVAVVNLLGRVFMNMCLDCPFRCMQDLLEGPLKDCPIILVDFHAEATSEKAAFANHFDGQVSLVWGTHTHVQTNDARLLPNGTGFISDLGMCGPQDSIIGMDRERAIERLISGLPSQYKSASGDALINGIYAEVCTNKYSTRQIKTISEIIRL